MTPGEARPQNAGLDCRFFTDLKFLQDASGKAVAHLPKAPENGGHLLQGAGTEHHQQRAAMAMGDVFLRTTWFIEMGCRMCLLHCAACSTCSTTSRPSSRLLTGLSVGIRGSAPVMS
jgi:hypothetical protein